MDYVEDAFFFKLFVGKVKKSGPIFGSPIKPAKRVDPLWVHPFCGLHSGPESGRCFLAHWRSVIDSLKVTVFVPVGVGLRLKLVRFGPIFGPQF